MANGTLPGGLSLFSMNFTHKGLSWAENICQNLEKICTDTAIVQNPCKYIDAIGEHFRKVFDEVAGDWLNPSDDCVEEPVAKLSSEHGLFSEVCKKSKVASHENTWDGNQLACAELKSFFSSVEELNSATSSHALHEISQNTAYDDHSEKLISISDEVMASNYPDGTRECTKDVSDPVAFLADVTSSLLSAAEVLPSEPDQNSMMEREPMLSGSTSSEKIDGTHVLPDTNSPLGLIKNEHEPNLESNKSEVSGQLPANSVIETYGDLDRGETSDVPNTVDQNAELVEEFEDVKVEVCWDDAVNDEVAFILKQACKNKSYKKKLKDAIISKVRSRKGYGHVGNCHDDIGSGLQSRQKATASSVSGEVWCSKASAYKSYDSDWVLL